MSVPKAMQEKYQEIEPLISAFCAQYLTEDYRTLCLKALEKLCRKRPSPLLTGKANTWAAGIVYAVAANNFIFDRSQPVHLTADELSAPFGLAKSTVANKAAQVSTLCDMNRMDPRWMLPELAEKNPMVWFLSVNGYMIDIRRAPLELQQEAFDRGFIPYVPALRQPDTREAQAAPEEAARPEPPKEEPVSKAEKETSEPAAPAPQEDFSEIYRRFGAEE